MVQYETVNLLTVNQRVGGSSPAGGDKRRKGCGYPVATTLFYLHTICTRDLNWIINIRAGYTTVYEYERFEDNYSSA